MDPSTLGAIWALINSMTGTPYTHSFGWGGTDCSGLASAVANIATGRPAFASRMNTRIEERWLLDHGFHYGTAPGALNIGFNYHHTAVTLPDGTNVSSGERGGVRVGGGGAFQRQFTRHMYLPMYETVAAKQMIEPVPEVAPVPIVSPAPASLPEPAPEMVPLPEPVAAVAPEMLPPPPAPEMPVPAEPPLPPVDEAPPMDFVEQPQP